MSRHLARLMLVVIVFAVASPSVTSAESGQSAIAGVVRDSTGAVLPGVTVEASSPALIENAMFAGGQCASRLRQRGPDAGDRRPGQCRQRGKSAVRRPGQPHSAKRREHAVGELLANFSNNDLASQNLDDDLIARGLPTLKVGLQQRIGWQQDRRQDINADLTQQYRNGVPTQVLIYNTPTGSRNEVDADLGVYVQDTWTRGRITIAPGLRVDYFNSSIPAQSVPAGRFVPARQFDAIPDIARWLNVSPRLGVSYDLFGTGKTALKGNLGSYVQSQGTGFAANYNPMVISTGATPGRRPGVSSSGTSMKRRAAFEA